MEIFEQIESWVQGSMTEAERIKFQQLMQEDAELAARVRVYTQLHQQLQSNALTSEGESSLRKTIREAIDEGKSVETIPAKRIPVRRKWLYGATAVAASLLIFFSIRLATVDPSVDPGKLYADYASFDDLSPTRGGKEDSLDRSAILYFNKKQYAQAVPALIQYLAFNPGQTKYHLALGYALMEQNRFAGADSIFMSVASRETVYKHQATWWLALSMLKQKKTAESIGLLKTIPSSSDLYSKANELLRKLD